jgi:hypothetical protein
LHAWKLDALADTVALLASELLTNAVEAAVAATPASGGEQLALTLRHTGPGVLVEVWDPNPAQAILQDPGTADESGRGLLLVEALSSTWGQRAVGRGKIVWCEVATEGDRGCHRRSRSGNLSNLLASRLDFGYSQQCNR